MEEAADLGPELEGRQLVFRLFLILWIATLVTLVGFGVMAVDQFGLQTTRRIWVALVVNLMLPLIAWQAFRLMNERRDRKEVG